ncbi:hypothetical protein EsH8_I_001560 [Colletotrichum jinshuiense]
MAQEDSTSISTSTSASTSSVPVPAPVPVPVPDVNDVAATSTTSTNSVLPPTSSTSPPPPHPSATPTLTLTPTPTPSAETSSIATANASATAPATAPVPATGPATAPAAVAPVAAPALPPQPNGDARASSSPAMSHQQPGPPRGYPSPNNFNSPGTVPQNQYAYHPQQNQPQADPYRASPGAPIPSLPSMKSLDHHYPQGAPPPQAMPMQMQMPPNQGMPYYLPPGVQTNPYMTQDLNHLRYPIPHGHDPRLMRGPGGPKKEIKRRTKTGCLTCRKRRIKCDEAHPSCNNCKKSKRECLGYDPIFKQQPGPSAIQPAPNAQRVPTPTVPSVPSSVPPTVPTVPSTPAAPPVPVPVASSNPYGNQPAVLPSSYNPPVTSAHAPLDPALTSTTPSVKPEASYDFAAPIDPALQNLPAPATVPSTQSQSYPGEQRAGFDNHLRAKKMKFDDLIGLLGPAAPTQEIALTPELLTEIINIYREVYAVGLQAFFEASWFQKQDAQGKFALEHSQALLGQFASFLKVVQSVPANDHTQMAHSGVLETRLIWALATLPCRSALGLTNADAKVLPPLEDVTEAANRVRVLEALLCGDFLQSNPLAPPVPDANPHRQQEFEFWHNLAQYVCYHDAAKRDEILGRLRLQLGGRENRDLIYSIAISREISPRVEPGFERSIPQHLDESDPKNRLYVANKFIQDEAQVTGGTTNIVRRFSEIAIRAFISPGVNVAAHPSPAGPTQP